MSSVQEEKVPAEAPMKAHIRELRNTELVSRLLAATPPYLYGALPLQPHAFFFSEMLRSFVAARHGCRPPHYHRRFKRRSHKYFAENDSDFRREWPKHGEEKRETEARPEVPLELTVEKHQRVRDSSPKRHSPKAEPMKTNGSPGPPGRQTSFVDVGTEELPKPSPCVGRNSTETATTPSNLILPPPPAMWYPPLYNPQFGVDPLNFFIDLRVSGHIYDKKRGVVEGNNLNMNQEPRPDELEVDKRLIRDFGQKPRHLSAFSVPVRSEDINVDAPAKYFDQSGVNRINFENEVNGTSYIMKNLKNIYENLKASRDGKEASKDDELPKEESSDLEDDIVD